MCGVSVAIYIVSHALNILCDAPRIPAPSCFVATLPIKCCIIPMVTWDGSAKALGLGLILGLGTLMPGGAGPLSRNVCGCCVSHFSYELDPCELCEL